MMAVVNRLIALGGRSARLLTATPNSYRGLSSSSSSYTSEISMAVVDTPALVRRLEAKGIPSETIASVVTEISNGNLNTVAKMHKNLKEQEANLEKFKSEIKDFQNDHCWMEQRDADVLISNIDRQHDLLNEISREMAEINTIKGRCFDSHVNQWSRTTYPS